MHCKPEIRREKRSAELCCKLILQEQTIFKCSIDVVSSDFLSFPSWCSFFLQGADSVIFVKGWGEGHTVETLLSILLCGYKLDPC